MKAGVLLLALILAFPASAQEKDERIPVSFDGIEVFGHILHSLRMKPLQSLSEVRNVDPADLLIVVFGDLLPMMPGVLNATGNLQDFIDRSGAILIASDRFYPGPILGATFTGLRHLPKQGSPNIFAGKMECPRLNRENCRLSHPLFKGLFQDGSKLGIACNCPSLLQVDDKNARSLVEFSETRASAMAGLKVPFDLPLQDPRRCLLIGGHGLFINEMLVQPSLENFDFALNVARWLQQSPGGQKRKQVLILHEGKVVSKIGLPIKFRPRIPIPTITILNHLLQNLQQEYQDGLWRILLIGATLLMGLYGLKKFFGNRYQLEPAPLMMAGGPGETFASLNRLRMNQQIDSGQFWEPMQVLIRSWFRTHTGQSLEFPIASAAQAPFDWRVRRWERWGLERQLHRVWSWARSSPGTRLRSHDLRQVEADLKSLSHAFEAGKLVYSPAPGHTTRG